MHGSQDLAEGNMINLNMPAEKKGSHKKLNIHKKKKPAEYLKIWKMFEMKRDKF